MRDLENTPFLFSEWFTRHQSVFTRDFPMYKIITICMQQRFPALVNYFGSHLARRLASTVHKGGVPL